MLKTSFTFLDSCKNFMELLKKVPGTYSDNLWTSWKDLKLPSKFLELPGKFLKFSWKRTWKEPLGHSFIFWKTFWTSWKIWRSSRNVLWFFWSKHRKFLQNHLDFMGSYVIFLLSFLSFLNCSQIFLWKLPEFPGKFSKYCEQFPERI